MLFGKVFYIPHGAVVREQAESMKLRMVVDASEDSGSPSLNECFKTGPSLQNLFWNVVVRNRMKPIALALVI